ncbi:MAG: hypothetical protein RLZZ500_2642 [Bacteroidota bacterium]
MEILTNNFHIICSIMITFLLSTSEVLFGKYKLNHNILLRKKGYLIWYGLYFSIVCLLINLLIFNGELKINSFDVNENKWKTAIFIGITIKAIARMNLYSFKLEGKEIFVGPKLVNEIFEDFLEKKISDNIDEQLLIEIKRVEKIVKKETLNELDKLISQCLPNNLSEIKRKSHLKEISQNKTKFDKLRYFAVKFGVNRLKQIETLKN